MTECPRIRSIQAWLDGDLPASEADAFAAHLTTCEACAAELAAFHRLFAVLDRAPVWDPGVALTEQVLDRVVPSRIRRRLVTVIGWAYATATAVSTFSLASWLSQPGTPHWIAGRLSELYLRALQSALLVLHTAVEGWVRIGDGWHVLDTMGERLAPFARALLLGVSQPAVAATIGAATVASLLVLRWMLPRAGAARTGNRKDVTHVDLLGF
jgi:anti-sigma factor RsiW